MSSVILPSEVRAWITARRSAVSTTHFVIALSLDNFQLNISDKIRIALYERVFDLDHPVNAKPAQPCVNSAEGQAMKLAAKHEPDGGANYKLSEDIGFEPKIVHTKRL